VSHNAGEMGYLLSFLSFSPAGARVFGELSLCGAVPAWGDKEGIWFK
jgi:hypothetical protein